MTLAVIVCANGTGDFAEIQEAIDASRPGDTILVCPGTYAPIEVGWGDVVVLRSIGGPVLTTIDGGADSAIVVVDGTLVLDGFRITGTNAVAIQEGVVTIRDSIFEGVTGDYALKFDEDLLVADGVWWIDNTSDVLWWLWQGDDALFVRNTVTGGTHEHVALTGRLDQLHVRDSVFHDITIDSGTAAFELETTGTGPMVLEHNLFYDIDDVAPWSGRTFSGDLDFRNNIVQGCNSGDLEDFDASYSVFWDNQRSYEPYVHGEGNLFVDPLLVDPERGDFHLAPGSPAIDAGDPDGTDIGPYDGP